MGRPAARSTQHHTGGRKYQRGGAVKYARGELYSAAGATGVEWTGQLGSQTADLHLLGRNPGLAADLIQLPRTMSFDPVE